MTTAKCLKIEATNQMVRHTQMNDLQRQNLYSKAFTLVEMLVVVAIIGIASAATLPHLSKMLDEQKVANIKGVLQSQMNLAKAYAAKSQKISGIRFQYDKDGWKDGNQYMVLIEKVAGGSPFQYQVVPYALPVPLPSGFGFISIDESADQNLNDSHVDTFPGDPDNFLNMGSATTFTMLFSPEGRGVIRGVELHRKNLNDNVVNIFNDVAKPTYDPSNALLYSDIDYGDDLRMPWLGRKNSVAGLVMFQTEVVVGLPDHETRATDYFDSVATLFLNMYTGDLFNKAVFDGMVPNE